MAHGAEGTSTPVDATHGLPVVDAAVEAGRQGLGVYRTQVDFDVPAVDRPRLLSDGSVPGRVLGGGMTPCS